MTEKKDLLIEIGVEELPHSFCSTAIEDFKRLFIEGLKAERISYGRVEEFVTPRRLSLLIRDVGTRQQDFKEEKRGPSVKRAYLPDGKPTKALEGFLKSNCVDESALVVRDSYLYIVQEVRGKNTEQILPSILRRCLGAMRFEKVMKWEDSGFVFARPIRWILFIFGGDIIPFEVAGINSGRFSWGHRSIANMRIEVREPDEYERKLYEASVIANRKRRKDELKRQVDELATTQGLEVPEVGKHLYDRNTDLTEFPRAVMCKFDEHFLELPPEVLISEMVEHQHYFPLVEQGTRCLSSTFIAVSNIPETSKSRDGYERVLRARLNDGQFFYSEDIKQNLFSYLPKLKAVTFHEKLGSMYQKVERLREIAGFLSKLLNLDRKTKQTIVDVVNLCKNDLLTHMVGEFPNLQGIMGYYYALSSGYPEDVATGIREHYYPRFAQDALPSRIEGAVVGIADRLDTIMGIFSIGMKPTGSKDPFGLRRNVLAIIRIIINMQLQFSMHSLIGQCIPLYRVPEPEVLILEVEDFIRSRMKTVFTEMGFLYDEIDASLGIELDDIYDCYMRIAALHEFRKNPDFESLLISFKRMSNIVKDQPYRSFSQSLLKEEDERILYEHFGDVKDIIHKNIEEKNYIEVFKILSTFKPSVDSFFDNVLVMDEDGDLRNNRIALLKNVVSAFSNIIDFTKIVQPGEPVTKA
ncbi:MAG: glycine--tRNA ligase subunit beta [Spirochaetota bacterium]